MLRAQSQSRPGELVGLGVFLLEAVKLRPQGLAARTFLVGEIHGLPIESTQACGVAIREVGSDRDPFPTLGAKSLRFGLELVDHQAIEERRIFQPTAIVMLEEIAHHDAAGRLIDFDADELCPLVGCPNRALHELAANVVRLLVVGACELLPDLLLPRMVVRHRERHQLLQRHAVLGVDLEELEPLLDDRRAHEELGRYLLLA